MIGGIYLGDGKLATIRDGKLRIATFAGDPTKGEAIVEKEIIWLEKEEATVLLDFVEQSWPEVVALRGTVDFSPAAEPGDQPE